MIDKAQEKQNKILIEGNKQLFQEIQRLKEKLQQQQDVLEQQENEIKKKQEINGKLQQEFQFQNLSQEFYNQNLQKEEKKIIDENIEDISSGEEINAKEKEEKIDIVQDIQKQNVYSWKKKIMESVYQIPDKNNDQKLPQETLVLKFYKLTVEEQRLFFYNPNQKVQDLENLQEAQNSCILQKPNLNPYNWVLMIGNLFKVFKKVSVIQISEQKFIEKISKIFDFKITLIESSQSNKNTQEQIKALILLFRQAIFPENEFDDSIASLDEQDEIFNKNYKYSTKKQTLSKKIFDNIITSFSIMLLIERLDKQYFLLTKLWLAKENKLYIFVDLQQNSQVKYFLQNKTSGFRVALNGRLLNVGKLEPCDEELIYIRNQIKMVETPQLGLESHRNNIYILVQLNSPTRDSIFDLNQLIKNKDIDHYKKSQQILRDCQIFFKILSKSVAIEIEYNGKSKNQNFKSYCDYVQILQKKLMNQNLFISDNFDLKAIQSSSFLIKNNSDFSKFVDLEKIYTIFEESFLEVNSIDKKFKNYHQQNPYSQIANVFLYSQAKDFFQYINQKNFQQQKQCQNTLQNLIQYQDGLAICYDQKMQIINQDLNMVLNLENLRQVDILIDFYPILELEKYQQKSEKVIKEKEEVFQTLGEDQFITFYISKILYEFILFPMLLGLPVFVIQYSLNSNNIINRLIALLYGFLLIFVSFYFMMVCQRSINHYKVVFGICQLVKNTNWELKNMELLERTNFLLSSLKNQELQTKIKAMTVGLIIIMIKSLQVYIVRTQLQRDGIEIFDYMCSRFGLWTYGIYVQSLNKNNFLTSKSYLDFISNTYIITGIFIDLNSALQGILVYPQTGFCGADTQLVCIDVLKNIVIYFTGCYCLHQLSRALYSYFQIKYHLDLLHQIKDVKKETHNDVVLPPEIDFYEEQVPFSNLFFIDQHYNIILSSIISLGFGIVFPLSPFLFYLSIRLNQQWYLKAAQKNLKGYFHLDMININDIVNIQFIFTTLLNLAILIFFYKILHYQSYTFFIIVCLGIIIIFHLIKLILPNIFIGTIYLHNQNQKILHKLLKHK